MLYCYSLKTNLHGQWLMWSDRVICTFYVLSIFGSIHHNKEFFSRICAPQYINQGVISHKWYVFLLSEGCSTRWQYHHTHLTYFFRSVNPALTMFITKFNLFFIFNFIGNTRKYALFGYILADYTLYFYLTL